MSWQRLCSLIWFDMRSEVDHGQLEEWDSWWDKPLGNERIDPQVLQTYVDMGQAVDLADAQHWHNHYQALAELSDPLHQAALSADFAAARKARLGASTA